MDPSATRRSLDAGLAFLAIVPAVLVPAWLFGRAEVAREAARSEEWRGVALARSDRVEGVPGLLARFEVRSGGVDDFGIAREAQVVVRDEDGREQALEPGLMARIREVAARAASDGDLCVSRDGRLVCAAVLAGGTRGVVLEPVPPSFPVAGVLWVWILGGLLVSGSAMRRPVARALAAGVGGGVGLAGAVAIARATDEAISALQTVEARIASAAGIPMLGHEPATGLPFVFGTAVVAAALCAAVHPAATRLFENLRSRPLVYAAIAPAMIGMVALIFIPFFMGVYLAFLDNHGNFIGLGNFEEILFPSETSDTNFYFTLGVTVLWTVLNVSLHVAIGLALALVLSDAGLRGRSVYRVLLIVPWAIPNYITALVWKWIFNTEYGPANAFLALWGLDPVDWLGRSFWTNFAANLATNTWLGFPFMMVVSLGALQSIPAELYEAAKMDGAGRWASFRNITLPLLKPSLFPAIILGTIWTFNMFNVVYLVSGGAPDNQTNILITEAYRAFRVLKNYGLAAAYSLIIFVILVVYTALTNRFTRAAESVYE